MVYVILVVGSGVIIDIFFLFNVSAIFKFGGNGPTKYFLFHAEIRFLMFSNS